MPAVRRRPQRAPRRRASSGGPWGHPTINPFLKPNDVKDQFNVRHPADDVANYLQAWCKLLEGNGYAPGQAAAAARIGLPDILRYDRARLAAYPNGRGLTHDVFSARSSPG